MQGYEVQQSSTAYPLVFLLVLSSDHITGATGLTPVVTLSKNGAAFASPSGAVAEIANGWYKVAGNATDTATLGPIILHASVATADPTDVVFPVVAVNPQSTAYGLVLAKTTNLTGLNDIAATAIVSAGAITTASGAVSTVTTVTNGVTVTTNNDKTGYSLTQAFPTNFAALGISVAGKINEVVLTDTLTTYTGDTPQTGDSFARIGANGAGLTSLAPASTALALTTAVATTGNTANTLADCLNASRAQGFGKWVISGTTLSLYAADGTTVVRSFTLDSATAPTQRI